MRYTAWLLACLALPLCAADNPIPNPGFETLGDGWATDWGRYNWGAAGSEGTQKIDTTLAHSGRNSLQSINISATAAGGAYCHVPLAAGTWALSFWAKAAPGETALVRCYLATAYSRGYQVGDRWTRVTFRNTLFAPTDRGEINIQNATRRPSTIWIDDVSLVPGAASDFKIVADRRPVAQQPKLLYFDAQLQYWADHAAEWRARGFSGAFYSYIYGDVHDDPWASDGDPSTRGEDDQLLQECRAANAKCRAAGLDCNVLKVAFYKDLPDPWDDAGYARLTHNFREGARFARLGGFAGFAIDTEYTAYQFDPSWQGYDLTKHTAAELAAKLQSRWADITETIVRQYPQVELMTLPEGAIHYGPLYNNLFAGMIEGLQRAGFTGGIHVFAESSYQQRDPLRLQEFVADVRETTASYLPPKQRDYWLRYGTVAVGCWPLGYYRAITDKDGKFLGWSGRKEVFGDKIVGSYADKSANYPLAEFRAQLAAARTLSAKYCWIYGHGSSWWQMTPEQADYYKANSHQHFSRENYLLPTSREVAEYYRTAAAREVVTGLK